MSKRKKKVDLTKYEHLFDGTYMVGGLKIKLLEELITIVKDLQIANPKLENELKEKKKQLKYLEPKSKKRKKVKKNEISKT